MDTSDKKSETKFSEQIARKEKRKLKARRVNSGSAWAGLGMFGMVGWSVAIPTLLGAGLGIWLDKKYHQTFSWTLIIFNGRIDHGLHYCMVLGTKEDKETHQDKE